MKLMAMAAAVAALLFMASGAMTQETALAPGVSHSVILDSTDTITEWSSEEISGISGVYGVVTIGRLGRAGTRPPTFSIMIAVGDDTAWLRFGSRDRESVLVEVLHDDGKSDTRVETGQAVPMDQPFDFDAAWTDGAVTFTVTVKGRPVQRFEVPLSGRPTKIAVYASNGQFKIDPLVLGRRP